MKDASDYFELKYSIEHEESVKTPFSSTNHLSSFGVFQTHGCYPAFVAHGRSRCLSRLFINLGTVEPPTVANLLADRSDFRT